MSLFDKTTNALGASLGFRLQRQNLIGSNIANAETPGYRAQKLDFEENLEKALRMEGPDSMSATHSGHSPLSNGPIQTLKADIYDNPDIAINNDKNTVDLEREMAELAENTILYRTAVELIRKKLGAMKYAVGEGGR